MSTLREQVIAEARTWVGTPYHHEGRVRGAGVDCGMLLLEVYNAVGLIPHVTPGHYTPDWHLHRGEEKYLEFVNRFCDQVETPLPGDVAVFRIGRCVSHGAIVLDWPMLIHAYHKQGCRVADATEAELQRHEVMFFRPRGIEGDMQTIAANDVGSLNTLLGVTP